MTDRQGAFHYDDVGGDESLSSKDDFKGTDGRRGPAVDHLNIALIALLEEDLRADNLVLNAEGRVSRREYAARLGIHSSYLCKVCGTTLERWDARLFKLRGGLSLIARAFVDVVRSDEKSQAGVMFRGRRINISKYAARLKVNRKAILSGMGSRLAELEAELERSRIASISAVKPRVVAAPSAPPKIISGSEQAEQLLSLLERDAGTEAGVKLTQDGTAYKRHYAKLLGVTTFKFSAESRALLAAWDEQLVRQRNETKIPLEIRLRAEIDGDIAAGRPIKLGSVGISRGHYAARVGVAKGTLALHCADALAEYDRSYGRIQNPEDRIDEMKSWLSDQFRQKTLPVRGGKIDRKSFERRFSLKGGAYLTRYAKIRTLFEEFDERVSSEGYQQNTLEADLQRLRAALDAGPALNKDRLKVSRPQLGKAIGIPEGRLWQSPFAEELRIYEEKILHRAMQSRLDPYLSGRVFQFSGLSGIWDVKFLGKIAFQFSKSFGYLKEKDRIKGYYLALYNLLKWIGNAETAFSRAVLRSAEINIEIDSRDWEGAVADYCDYIRREIQVGGVSKNKADNKIIILRNMLRRMSPVLPELESELLGIKHARAFTVPRSSLAEISKNAHAAKGSEYIDFTNNMLRQAADRFKIDLEHKDAVQFVEALMEEMERADDLPSDAGHAILLVLNRRLDAIRNAALRHFERSCAAITEGESLLAAADIDGSTFFREYSGFGGSRYERGEFLRRWFPKPVGPRSDEAIRRSRANLLALAIAEFGGFLPGLANEKALANVGQFFQKRYNEIGRLEELSALLNPSRDACGAVLTLYLTESGANVAVGRSLQFDCIEEASEPGFKLITGHKARAKGKPIYAELPSNSPAIRAIEWYATHSKRYREVVGQADARSLFLLRIAEECQLAGQSWYTNWFKNLCAEIPAFSGALATPSMIRPSVLLKAALENDGRLQVGRAIGQHGQTVTNGYQLRLPVRMLRDQHMRRFQRHYETRVLQNIVDVARSLGISSDEFDQRLGELQATGLGTFCVDPHGRPGSDGQRCQAVDCWRDCPQLLIVANVEAIALLQIWQQSLRDSEGDWERDHPERWEEVWLPWLCLTDVVQEKMSRGPLMLVWKQAQIRAAALIAQPEFVPPRAF